MTRIDDAAGASPHPLLAITSGPSAGRRIAVDRELVLGRESADVPLDDKQASRRHAAVRPVPGGIEVRDLGSTNGTLVNGAPIAAPHVLRAGDQVQIGSTTLGLAPEPELATVGAGPVVVGYRRGSFAEGLAAEYADAAGKAVADLKLGAAAVRVNLVDPFPDPADPSRMVAGGSVVDSPNATAWVVATAEAPPEPPARVVALLLAASLPAGADLDELIEGWGLHVSGAPDSDAFLEGQTLPPFESADGDLRAAMAVSFVGYLIEGSSEKAFLSFLREARPGHVDEAAQETFGHPLAVLEERWRERTLSGAPPVKTGQFLRLTARYLRPYKWRQAEVFLWMLLALAFTVVFPFAFKELLDSAIPSGQFSEVATILGVLGAAFVLTLVAGVRRSYVSAVISSSVIRDVRMQMFGRLQRLDAGWYHRHEAGDVLARLFSDVDQLEMGLSQALRDGLFQIISLVVSAVILMLLNPLLGAVVLLGAPLVAIVYRMMSAEAQKRSIAVQQQLGEATTVANESYGGQPVVKAFGLEERETQRFQRASDRLFGAEVKLMLFGGYFSLSVELIVTLLRLAVLALGAWLIFEGHLTIGGLVAFTSLMGEVLAPVTVLTGIGQQIQASTGSLARINDVLDAEPAIADAPGARDVGPVRDAIELHGVSFSYTPERRTLDGIDVRIEAGARVAFVGPSGAGKSSVLGLIMRFYDPDEGDVTFDGVPLTEATLSSVRGQMGVVFQDTFLFNTTIRENIAMGAPGASLEQVREAARAARLDDFVDDLPEGYDAVVGERGARLSGGQRQRLAIARALLRNPSVLLLDEATSALDPRTEQQISKTLEAVSEGRTTIAITHRLTSITDYDRIFVIAAGRLVEQGGHDELLEMGGTYATLWAEQTGAIDVPRPTVDVGAALAQVPLFAELSESELSEVESRLRPMTLAPGQRLPEGGGRLALVARGSAETLLPGLRGELAPAAELGPGQAFGLGALLGESTGAVLQARDPVSLLVLDDEALAGLSARMPAVAAALSGEGGSVIAPVGGRRMAAVSAVLSRPVLPDPGPRFDGEVERQLRDRASRAANPMPLNVR